MGGNKGKAKERQKEGGWQRSNGQKVDLQNGRGTTWPQGYREAQNIHVYSINKQFNIIIYLWLGKYLKTLRVACTGRWGGTQVWCAKGGLGSRKRKRENYGSGVSNLHRCKLCYYLGVRKIKKVFNEITGSFFFFIAVLSVQDYITNFMLVMLSFKIAVNCGIHDKKERVCAGVRREIKF